MNMPDTSLLSSFKGSRGRAKLALALGLAAMLLILLSELWPQRGADTQADSASAALEYQQELERRLAELISQIDGAGRCAVMVTLESGEERVYATDTLTGESQSQTTHVLLDSGGALEQTVRLPRVCGAAVICDGGGDVRVAARVTELVSALLDIPSNRVCVEPRGS